MKRNIIVLLTFLSAIAVYSATPKETMERAKEGRTIEPDIVKEDGVLEVEVLLPGSENDTQKVKVRIPRALEIIRKRENTNDLNSDLSVFDDIELDVLGPYEPIKGTVFYVPYIPIPAERFRDYLVGSNFSDEMRKTLFFKYEGKEYVRFFIHPSRTSSYDDVIEKFGIVRNEFLGFLGTSPRSIYVWHPDNEYAPFQAKTSLHFEVNGDKKLNLPIKTARSHGVNELMASISAQIKKEYNFDFLPESLQLIPERKQVGTFYRDISPLLKRGNRYVPGFYLTSVAEGQSKSLVEKLLSNRADPVAAAAEMLTPMIRLNAYLMFVEGLKGELHEQNVYFELDERDIPTGRLLLKDLDGYRVDLEMRLRNNLSVEVVRNIDKPFVYLKFKKASGFGPGNPPPFDDSAFTEYFIHTFGYSFCKVLKCTDSEKNRFYKLLNTIMAKEVAAITGIPFKDSEIGKPKDSWLGNYAKKYRDSVNKKKMYDGLSAVQKSAAIQSLMLQQYLRLQGEDRTSATIGTIRSPDAYFVLHQDSIIEARMRAKDGSERSIGFAALEGEDSLQAQRFLAKYKRLLKDKVEVCKESVRKSKRAS